MSVVYVSALFDMGKFENNLRRQQLEKYLKDSYFTMHLFPLVVFTEPHLVEPLQAVAARHENKVQFVPLEITELKYLNSPPIIARTKANANMHPLNGANSDKLTPSYLMLMWNKFEFIARAYDMYPHATVLAWIDMGIGKLFDNALFTPVISYAVEEHRLALTVMNPLTDGEYKSPHESFGQWYARVCGNYWTVGRYIFPMFHKFVQNEIVSMLDLGYAAADEEILARFLHQNPALCISYFGTYVSSIKNRPSLKFDFEESRMAVQKAHVHSLHYIACDGFMDFLDAVLDRHLAGSAREVFEILMNLYIHWFYLDIEIARQIGCVIFRGAHVHPIFAHMIFMNLDHMRSTFGFAQLNVDDLKLFAADDVVPDQSLIRETWLRSVEQWIERDVDVFLKLSTVPADHEWSRVFLKNIHHFKAIQMIIARCKTGLTGSYLMKNDLSYEAEYFTKQTNLYDLVKRAKPRTVLEIGVNAGHSLLIMLLAHPIEKMDVFDVCVFDHTRPCIEYLNRHFNNCIRLIVGESPGTVEMHLSQRLTYDVYHIDGCHQWNVIWQEVLLCGATARPGAFLILDDVNHLPYCYNSYAEPVPEWASDSLVPNSAYRIVRPLPTLAPTRDVFAVHDTFSVLYRVLLSTPSLISSILILSENEHTVPWHRIMALRQHFPTARIHLYTGSALTWRPERHIQYLTSVSDSTYELMIDDGTISASQMPWGALTRALVAGGCCVCEKRQNLYDIDLDHVKMETFNFTTYWVTILWKSGISIQEIYHRVKPFTCLSAERIANNIECVDYVVQHNVRGDFVEMGVWRGGSVASMALRLTNYPHQQRTIHLFDTFAGMTPPTSADVDFLGTPAHQIMNEVKCEASLSEVQSNLDEFRASNVELKYHVGDVRNTYLEAPDRISILRLDIDWYDTTLFVLLRLYPKISKGGFVIVDDYGHWKGCRRAVDEFLSTLPNRVTLHPIDYTGVYWRV